MWRADMDTVEYKENISALLNDDDTHTKPGWVLLIQFTEHYSEQ